MKMSDTKADEDVGRDVDKQVREANRFAIQLPVVGRVPIPRPDQLAFYGALAGLVLVEMIDWPVAVAIGVGHALVSERQTAENNGPEEHQP
jgi:hypothetical protein